MIPNSAGIPKKMHSVFFSIISRIPCSSATGSIIFKWLKAGKIDTWDHQFHFLTFFENGLCIVPNVKPDQQYRVWPGRDPYPEPAMTITPIRNLGELKSLTHPNLMVPDKEADYFLFNNEFRLDEKRLSDEKRSVAAPPLQKMVPRII